jgi:hypothetical protein
LQTRTFTASAHGGDCRAFAQPARARVSCTLEVTVELRGRGASPMQTGSSLLRGRKVQTAYASIGVCLSGPSLVHPSTCMTDVQGCQIPTTKSVPDCYPSWAARVATQFQYDGRQVRRIWLDPCCDIGLGFALKESRAFSLPRSNVAGKPLAIGMDVAVTGTVPIARAIRSTYTLRIMALPNGGAVFQVR